MEQETQPKIIFGLSSNATIINAFALLFISQIFWCLYFIKQLPSEFNFSDYISASGAVYIENIPWYVDSPFQILSMIMVLYWIGKKYNIQKSDYSWRGIKYKFIYPVCGFTIAGSLIKILILSIIL